MTDCEYCDEEFSDRKSRLEHELDEHEDEMSSHDKSDKKSELNKLEQKKQTDAEVKKKKLIYGAIGVLLLGLVAGGGYFAAQNIDVGPSIMNESLGVGEPIHWHADYQITVCGEEKVLNNGPMTAHTHGQKSFHLEGTRMTKEEATLDWIVDQLGGQLENDSIVGRDNCNGEPANLTVEVNGEQVENHLDYIPKDEDNIVINYE